MAKIKNYLKKVIVIDTSALIKAFLNEPGQEFILNLLTLNLEKELTLLAPRIMTFELLNTLAKKLQNESAVKEAYEKFQELGIGIMDIDTEYFDKAIEITAKNPQVSFYDASYHALAKHFKGIFLTADKKYYESLDDKKDVHLIS